jgi:hypothetical protein
MNYVLTAIGLIALIISIGKKQWTASLISLAFTSAPILLFLDNRGLFYHSLGLVLCGTTTFIIHSILSHSTESKRTNRATMLVAFPYLLICVFKMFQFPWIANLKWILLVTILSFLFLTFERRKLDHHWFLCLFIAVSSVTVLLFL